MKWCPCAFRALSCVLSRPVLCVPYSIPGFPFPFQSGFDCFSRLHFSAPVGVGHLAASSSLFPSTFLVKHLRHLNFHPFLPFSRPVRSSSNFISRVAASLAVFVPLSVFRFRVPLMSYPARSRSRFPAVFQISSVVFNFFRTRAIIFLSFYIKITLISNRSRPLLSHLVPPTRLPALY